MISISFIIPTLNEGRHIGDTIDSIVEATGNRWIREIIVVDNGSWDETALCAKEKGATVLICPDESIGSLRNRGAAAAQGEIFIFLDGDVALTPRWGREIGKVFDRMDEEPLTVTGSICGIPERPSWLERYWFDPALRRVIPGYVNSGHMIVSRALFDRVKGFDECLETGEDVDICRRARSVGASVVVNPGLPVIHKGYPRTMAEFYRREQWHGIGDYSSIRKVTRSKPALVSLFLLSVFVIALAASGFTGTAWPFLLFAFIFAGICLLSAVARFGMSGFPWIRGAYIYSFYFAARAGSFVAKLVSRRGQKTGPGNIVREQVTKEGKTCQ